MKNQFIPVTRNHQNNAILKSIVSIHSLNFYNFFFFIPR